MKLLNAETNEIDRQDLRKLKDLDKKRIRVGLYYSKYDIHQKARFTRIVNSLSSQFQLHQQKHHKEMILIRQVAADTIRIEGVEREILQATDLGWVKEAGKWILLAEKERRDALHLLYTLTKVGEKTNSVDSFKGLRDTVRELENLPVSEQASYHKDGHDRRYYDKVTRTKK